MALGSWLRDNAGVYFGNAATTRDFRVQLRGNRAVLLWAFYLLVLIGFAMIVYNSAVREGGQTSIVEAQARLRSFYQSIMILLAVMINVITPALTAGAIVMERQRHSLDLVFSAPVTPKYLLVGKMISSYRYTWMLLILSLPVTSACVVLGGATWSDVISAYLILSFTALVYTSLALLLSTLAKQPVSAVIWSYVAAAAYSIVSAMFVASSSVYALMGSKSLAAPFVVAINPYFVVQAAPTYTEIWGYHVPNWLLGGLFCLLLCRLIISAGASALSGYGSWETKSFRIHGLVYAALFLTLGGYSMGVTLSTVTSMMRSSGGVTSASTAGYNAGVNMAFGWMLAPLIMLIPFLTCYARDAERKFWPDGLFSIRKMLVGSPSGALPYIWAMIILGYLGMTWMLSRYLAPTPSPAILFWSLALWTFFWSLGRFSSSLDLGLRSARALHFTIMMALVALPVPFFSVAANFDSTTSNIWDIYILRPLLGSRDNTVIALVEGGVLVLAAVLMTYLAETNAARKGVSRSRTA